MAYYLARGLDFKYEKIVCGILRAQKSLTIMQVIKF